MGVSPSERHRGAVGGFTLIRQNQTLPGRRRSHPCLVSCCYALFSIPVFGAINCFVVGARCVRYTLVHIRHLVEGFGFGFAFAPFSTAQGFSPILSLCLSSCLIALYRFP